jgi:hypothetical protein
LFRKLPPAVVDWKEEFPFNVSRTGLGRGARQSFYPEVREGDYLQVILGNDVG